MTYFCVDDDHIIGQGESLEDAYDDYRDSDGEESINRLTFYEATEIKVKAQILKVEKTVINKAAKKG